MTSYKKRPLFAAAFRMELRTTQAPIKKALGSPSSGIKGPESKSDLTVPLYAAPKLRRYEDVLPLPHIFFPLEYLTTSCGLIIEVRQKLALSLLRTGEEYREVKTYVIAYQKVKVLLFAQFSHRDGAPGSSSTEGRISLTPSLLCSCYGTMPGLLLIVCRIFLTSLIVRNTSSLFK